MARMHARRKGRSGSSPQTRKENPKWSPKAKDGRLVSISNR